MILGIDPGLKGGMAILDRKGKLIDTWVMPTVQEKELDLVKIVEIFNFDIDKVQAIYMEKVGAMPKQGVSSTFKFGTGYGQLQGIIAASQLPYKLVPPRTWQKSPHAGLAKQITPKNKTIIAVGRKWPKYDFRKNDKCRIVHDGLADAALIALFGVKDFYR